MNGIEGVISNVYAMLNFKDINSGRTGNRKTNGNNNFSFSGNVTPGSDKNNKFKPDSNFDLTKPAKSKNNGNQKKAIIQMLHRIRKELNPPPMLPTAYILNWDEKEKAVVIDIVDNRTGRIIGTVPPSQVLKYLKDYHRGMFYNDKS
ncbi:flagellar protein FlaG [Candidatus Acidulodesulfobacterium sp. H_13]|uniref:flagellar protein FlaG n=1 Tax=Candidatus Acidulodesulfobacterium sp. H_13 TaxID=3395470 RepID=UPI003AF5115B